MSVLPVEIIQGIFVLGLVIDKVYCSGDAAIETYTVQLRSRRMKCL